MCLYVFVCVLREEMFCIRQIFAAGSKGTLTPCGAVPPARFCDIYEISHNPHSTIIKVRVGFGGAFYTNGAAARARTGPLRAAAARAAHPLRMLGLGRLRRLNN